MSDIFTATNEVTIETLVGDNRKYKDPNELAKAYANADAFIEQLKRENAELKAQQELAARKAPIDPAPQPKEPDPAPVSAKPAVNGGDDLAERIRAEIERNNAVKAQQTNLEQAVTALVQKVGSEQAANEMVRAKAAELGVSVDFLKSTAATSPKGFLKLVGVEDEQAPVTNTPGIRREVNTAALANTNSSAVSKPGTWAYFEKIRRENPNLYFSPRIQKELWEARQKTDPSDFYAKA